MVRRRKAKIPRELELSGPLSLAFVNTAATRRDNRELERRPHLITAPLESYSDLLTWGQRLGTLTATEATDLRRLADQSPDDATAAFAAALDFRALLGRIFRAPAAKKNPAVRDLDALNAAFEAAPARRVVRRSDGYEWDWTTTDGRLDRVLWPLALETADLLTSQRWHRVRACANRDCTWLFLPKSTLRIWCDPQTCGSREWGKRARR